MGWVQESVPRCVASAEEHAAKNVPVRIEGLRALCLFKPTPTLSKRQWEHPG